MNNSLDSHESSNLKLFRERIATARRLTGHQQKELANTLGLNAHVLSRKLHGTSQARLAPREVKKIIQILAEWNAITTRKEAYELLSIMGMNVDNFSQEEWTSAPLNLLKAVNLSEATASVRPAFSEAIPLVIPASTNSFIGREWLEHMLCERLRQRDVRLLTLVGTGGVGKTRLSLQIARQLIQDFPDGLYFVVLSTFQDSSFVPSAIAKVLGLSEPILASTSEKTLSYEQRLKLYLQTKKVLLILDNFEHVLDAASFIGELLAVAPNLKVLVTSRSPLRIYGEQEFNVPPLEVYDPEQVKDVTMLKQSPAVRLFVGRVQAFNQRFVLTHQTTPIVARICMFLGGLPLAIELAAARCRILPPQTLLARFEESNPDWANRGDSPLSLLRQQGYGIPARQLTLEQTLNWSYHLLPPQTQHVFSQLSIFPGGWTLQEAQAICILADEPVSSDILLDQLDELVRQSLIIYMEVSDTEEELSPRFHFLELIRQYALRHLHASGKYEAVARRHVSYYLQFVEQLEADMLGKQRVGAFEKITLEQDNIRAALQWAVARHKAEIVQRFCGPLGFFWEAQCQFQEAHRWIDIALEMSQTTPIDVRANVSLAASRLLNWEMSVYQSRVFAERALTLYKESENRAGQARALFQIGDAYHMEGVYREAIAYFEESMHLQREVGGLREYAFVLGRLGAIATLQGDLAQGKPMLIEAVNLLREHGEPALFSIMLTYLGMLYVLESNLEQALTCLFESVLIAQKSGARYILATTWVVSGLALGRALDPSYAARICSAADHLFKNLGTSLAPAYVPLYTLYLESIRGQAAENSWRTWWQEGETLSPQEVISLMTEGYTAYTGKTPLKNML